MGGFARKSVRHVDAKYSARTPWPNFALTAIDPLPTNILIPQNGRVAVPIFAIKDQDRAGLTIEAGGTIFRVNGEIWNNAVLNRCLIGLTTGFDISGSGNGIITIEADTEDDTGAVIETTHQEAAVTSNDRFAPFSLGEGEPIPGLQLLGTSFYDLVLYLRTDFAQDRFAALRYLEVWFLKIGELAP